MRIDRSAAWMMLPMCIVVVSFALADVVSVKNDVSLECDVVVYGSSPAAISAAVQAKRMGRSVVVVSPESRIGGLTTGGLGATDIGNKAAFGGIALEFYRDVAAWYSNPEHWTHQRPEEYFPGGQRAGARGNDTMWTFEPSAALAILEGWEKRDGLDVRRGEWLDREKGVEKKAGRIVAIRTLSGRVYHGRVFIDATSRMPRTARRQTATSLGQVAPSTTTSMSAYRHTSWKATVRRDCCRESNDTTPLKAPATATDAFRHIASGCASPTQRRTVSRSRSRKATTSATMNFFSENMPRLKRIRRRVRRAVWMDGIEYHSS